MLEINVLKAQTGTSQMLSLDIHNKKKYIYLLPCYEFGPCLAVLLWCCTMFSSWVWCLMDNHSKEQI